MTQHNATRWEYVIGLEIHAQITSTTKLFSAAPTKFGMAPNSQMTLFDAALPGVLPTLNKYCLSQAIKTGLALNCRINTHTSFDRKNYFYPDLPSGYQISQLYHPIAVDGWLEIEDQAHNLKKIGIQRLHIEQDAGKSMHDQFPNYTLIDLNRSNTGLMEIVSLPHFSSADEVTAYIKKLRSILKYLGTSDGDMEKGSLRCDVNLSVRKPGMPLGTRCEIKNLNSMRNITKAIEYEGQRQIQLLEAGKVIKQETLLFDATTDQTRPLRSKEDSADYRYFPDPDLPTLKLDETFIEELRNQLPELPDAKAKRYVETCQITAYDAEVLVSDKETAEYFEAVISEGVNPKLAANWIIVELFGYLNKSNLELDKCKSLPIHLAELIKLLENEVISSKIAKTVFAEMFTSGLAPSTIIQEQNWGQITDPNAVLAIIQQVLAENPDSVASYRAGKDKLFSFFVGQVMKKSGSKANPKLVNEILQAQLTLT